MNKKSIAIQVKSLVAEYAGLDSDSIKEEDNLQYSLGLDSIDNVELIQNLNEQFSIQLGEAEVSNISTVSDLINVVQKSIAENQQLF